jgi:membrane associated rhomboid family serine protease
MGIQNRDYIREDRPGWRVPSTAPGCKWLIIANVVIFVLQIATGGGRGSGLGNWLDLSPRDVLHGEVWRLVTYAFCHSPGDILHIVFNMLFVYWFGKTLEQMYGTREFVMFYFAAALVSGLAFFAIALALRDPTPAVGASGAVMAIVMLYAIHFPHERIYLFGIIAVPIWLFVLGYLVYDLTPVLQALSGGGRSDGVAHSAHLGGLAFGFLYRWSGMRLDRLTSGLGNFGALRRRMRVRRPPESIRIYEPPSPETKPENLELQVDQILQKIQEHGEKSLTDKEREVLRRASERYKENQRHR